VWARDGRIQITDLPDGESGIFLQTGLDRQIVIPRTDLPVGQISRSEIKTPPGIGRRFDFR
jgi:hypothetical protein